jgi:hypothetical protein
MQKSRNFVAFVQKTHKRSNDFSRLFVQYIEFYLEKLLYLTLFNLFVIIQLCATKNKPYLCLFLAHNERYIVPKALKYKHLSLKKEEKDANL